MTLTIVTTPGSADANAYCTLAEAEAYVATMTESSSWTGKTDEQKKAAIIQGARWLDTIQWRGVRSSQAQAMAWPRCGSIAIPRFDGLNVAVTGYLTDQDGYLVDSSAIPVCVKNANAEMAVRQLAADWTAGLGPVTQETLKVGPIELGRKSYKHMPSSVMALVRHFIAVSPDTGGRLVRS